MCVCVYIDQFELEKGDGLLFEVLNGIMSRQDWKSVTQRIALGIIPAGIRCSNGRISM
jgi:hypothetical protein